MEYALIDNIQIPGRDLSPSGSISINNKSSYNRRYNSWISVNLSASDDYGIIAYYLSSYNTTPSTYSSWTSISKTTSFNSNVVKNLYYGYGTNYIYVWYKDTVETSHQDIVIHFIVLIQGIVIKLN